MKWPAGWPMGPQEKRKCGHSDMDGARNIMSHPYWWQWRASCPQDYEGLPCYKGGVASRTMSTDPESANSLNVFVLSKSILLCFYVIGDIPVWAPDMRIPTPCSSASPHFPASVSHRSGLSAGLSADSCSLGCGILTEKDILEKLLSSDSTSRPQKKVMNRYIHVTY